jgi:hypothetical protein
VIDRNRLGGRQVSHPGLQRCVQRVAVTLRQVQTPVDDEDACGSDNSDLRQFVVSYFHPDWDLDDETATDVVDRFRAVEAPDRVIRVRREIERLLRDEPDDGRLRSLLLDPYWIAYAAKSDELARIFRRARVRDRLDVVVERCG